MTEEQINSKAKDQFPYDEFLQQSFINAINWAIKEMQEENEKLTVDYETLKLHDNEEIGMLLEQIEKMKNRCNCYYGVYGTVGNAFFKCNLNLPECRGCKQFKVRELAE